MTVMVSWFRQSQSLVNTELPPFAKELPVAADIGTHDRVVELMSRLPCGRVLECAAGSGILALRLQALGFSVTAVDLQGKSSFLGDLPWVVANLDVDSFPFADEAFDILTCVEGIEHLENAFHTAREFNRVLRRGGFLVLTTPNILCFSSRLRFLLAGFYNKYPRPLDESRREPSFHINPMTYPWLRYVLVQAGFRITYVTMNRVKTKEWLFIPLYPFIYVLTRIALSFELNESTRRTTPQVRREVLSLPVLLGQALILIAQKL